MLRALLCGVAACALATGQARAEIATDGTMGARIRLTDRDVTIDAALGTIRGGNLFHSFERFEIENGGSATFTGPAGLDRVISRVTGGQASTIDGTLRSTVPGADFYFINPAGIFFGANARLDVPAAFHAATADELRFPGGDVYSATEPGRSVLSVAAPEAFGFLGARPESITLIQGRLEVAAGSSLSLVGGSVDILGTGVPSADGVASAPGGTLTLAALGGPGVVPIDDAASLFDPAIDTTFAAGLITMFDGATVTSSGDGGGRVRIRGGQLVMGGDSRIDADNSGNAAADGGITVRVGRMDVGTGAAITADALAGGRAGRIAIAADDLTILGSGVTSFTGIASNAEAGTGSAGEVTVDVAGLLEILAGGGITSGTFTAGDAGPVTVMADTLSIERQGIQLFTGIASQATPGSTGSAGDVTVTVGRDLLIRDGGEISSSTFADGAGGKVLVRAGKVSIDGTSDPDDLTGISSDTVLGAGAAGEVTLEVTGELELKGGGLVGSNTFAAGDAGRVVVDAGKLTIDRGLAPDRATGVVSQARDGTGDAGEVTVTVAGALSIRNGGKIASDTITDGDAGEVTVRAGRLVIDGAGFELGTGLSSDARAGTGDAGRVTVTVDGRAILRDGGSIASNTFTPGAAGEVTFTAGRAVIDGTGTRRFTGISSTAAPGSAGPAGEVTVTTRQQLALLRGGIVISGSSAAGDAGTVTVRAGSLVVDGANAGGGLTGISSDVGAGSAASGGSVRVTAARALTLRNSGSIGSSNFGTGQAGDVTIEASRLLLDNGIVSSASFTERGGRVGIAAKNTVTLVDGTITTNGTLPVGDASVIALAAPTVIVVGQSEVLALTGDGEPIAGAGVVDIRSRRAFIGERSAVLGSSSTIIGGLVDEFRTPSRLAAEPPADPARALRDCAEERLGGRGSFKAAGPGGLPAGPEDFLGGMRSGGEQQGATLVAGCAGTRR